MKKVFIIAEAGVNHNGDINIARKMIDAAKDSSVDAVKFQTFKAEDIISKSAPKAAYQRIRTKEGESQLEMAEKLEFGRDEHLELLAYCREKSIMFLSSPFDLGSIDLLADLGLRAFKIPSGEMTNLPYLRKIGSLSKEIYLSTGMSTEKEIREALDILIKCGTRKDIITLLHCNTAYPTPFEDVNLLAMQRLKDLFKVEVGYSDHTLGIEVAIAAVALGATVIEKHFTLDKAMEGPDHAMSLLPEELKSMVLSIRNIEKAIGSPIKLPSSSEKENILIARKSIIAATKIKKNERFTNENLAVKRPALGISPMRWDEVIRKKAKKDFDKDEPIEL